MGPGPDLIAVTGAGGRQGYADRLLIEAEEAKNPVEAVRRQKAEEERYRRGERIARSVPVYDLTGKQIDVFHIYLSSPEGRIGP